MKKYGKLIALHSFLFSLYQKNKTNQKSSTICLASAFGLFQIFIPASLLSKSLWQRMTMYVCVVRGCWLSTSWSTCGCGLGTARGAARLWCVWCLRGEHKRRHGWRRSSRALAAAEAPFSQTQPRRREETAGKEGSERLKAALYCFFFERKKERKYFLFACQHTHLWNKSDTFFFFFFLVQISSRRGKHSRKSSWAFLLSKHKLRRIYVILLRRDMNGLMMVVFLCTKESLWILDEGKCHGFTTGSTFIWTSHVSERRLLNALPFPFPTSPRESLSWNSCKTKRSEA